MHDRLGDRELLQRHEALLAAMAALAGAAEGQFDATAGAGFLTHVLERGGERDAMDLFVAFRGREPKIDALLRHSGING